ncbi:archease [Micromonospora sp. HSS6-12]|uniref:Archease n=1 Tax=Micromonospora thermarum TaxID=2720024 RepID=A0ABX0ZDM8_9ACTN|nr:archease [Micromonospora thermarum]
MAPPVGSVPVVSLPIGREATPSARIPGFSPGCPGGQPAPPGAAVPDDRGVDSRPERGHRCVPHTADVRIEAWAPTREACVAEAVTALVDSFTDPGGARPAADREFHTPPADDQDLLVDVLDEVIFRMDTTGELPLRTEVTDDGDGGLRVRWQTVGTDALELIGAVPKAVALHELRFGPDGPGWSCAVTLDV